MDTTFQSVGVALASRCVFCSNIGESAAHIFINCKYAISVWEGL